MGLSSQSNIPPLNTNNPLITTSHRQLASKNNPLMRELTPRSPKPDQTQTNGLLIHPPTINQLSPNNHGLQSSPNLLQNLQTNYHQSPVAQHSPQNQISLASPSQPGAFQGIQKVEPSGLNAHHTASTQNIIRPVQVNTVKDHTLYTLPTSQGQLPTYQKEQGGLTGNGPVAVYQIEGYGTTPHAELTTQGATTPDIIYKTQTQPNDSSGIRRASGLRLRSNSRGGRSDTDIDVNSAVDSQIGSQQNITMITNYMDDKAKSIPAHQKPPQVLANYENLLSKTVNTQPYNTQGRMTPVSSSPLRKAQTQDNIQMPPQVANQGFQTGTQLHGQPLNRVHQPITISPSQRISQYTNVGSSHGSAGGYQTSGNAQGGNSAYQSPMTGYHTNNQAPVVSNLNLGNSGITSTSNNGVVLTQNGYKPLFEMSSTSRTQNQPLGGISNYGTAGGSANLGNTAGSAGSPFRPPTPGRPITSPSPSPFNQIQSSPGGNNQSEIEALKSELAQAKKEIENLRKTPKPFTSRDAEYFRDAKFEIRRLADSIRAVNPEWMVTSFHAAFFDE